MPAEALAECLCGLEQADAFPRPLAPPTWTGPTGAARRGTVGESPAATARSAGVLAAVMMLALVALAMLTALRFTLAFLTRRRIAAWEAAWSRVDRSGPSSSDSGGIWAIIVMRHSRAWPSGLGSLVRFLPWRAGG